MMLLPVARARLAAAMVLACKAGGRWLDCVTGPRAGVKRPPALARQSVPGQAYGIVVQVRAPLDRRFSRARQLLF